MLTHLKRTITTGALVATLAAGTFTGVAQAETTTNTPGTAAESGYTYLAGQHKYKFKYIKQDQGQRWQWVDCGPTSVLMALLDNGGQIPRSYNERNQAAAITELRSEAPSGGAEGTNNLYTADVVKILENRGVSGTAMARDNAVNAIAELKQGKKAIVLTQTGILREGKTDPGYGHFVYVSGYNPRTGTFTVNDPLNKRGRSFEASEAEMHTMITSPAKGNNQWVYVI
ncbi:C39 family peptidase [Corynebacterium oculi]|uniref:Peptidase C39-like domain-containing protein n=1 Tax=Corynebacterium oculi TaxID=1544416 RepID=A0A0Q0YE38_9CORY|nr:C39 family peptidase [Corynebacterium oculi]KQB84606.1 hypothetical protein Cocul_01414 [Corynebacterium oculi]